ncbi:serpin family protein, partial [Staphylococcus aureus]|uniref:serpin family protein n=1 Tax=Staphylococcus aureus TaxID=1280 RepID=UPI0038B327D4
MFGLDADLSGITGNKDLYVSEIVHKAVIEVNEQGSEASAISGGFISNRIRPFPDIINEFNVDHPFLFYIIDNRTKA